MTTRFIGLAALMLTISSCNESHNTSLTEAIQTEKKVEKIPLSGIYSWTFDAPKLGVHKSTNVFFADSIQYSLVGPINVKNTQTLEHYDSKEKRCITKRNRAGKDVYTVMFFKDITDSTVIIYKHECKEGKEEAISFPYPAADASADYGWNTYKKEM